MNLPFSPYITILVFYSTSSSTACPDCKMYKAMATAKIMLYSKQKHFHVIAIKAHLQSLFKNDFLPKLAN
jgi:hypothetical protein